jgi:hypothetical protein
MDATMQCTENPILYLCCHENYKKTASKVEYFKIRLSFYSTWDIYFEATLDLSTLNYNDLSRD